MGWTTYFVNTYGETKQSLMTKQLESYGDVKVLKSSIKGNVYYAACINVANPDKVWAIVCLTSLRRGEFGFKDMDETMEPYYYDCPKSIINMLSPTTNEYALRWRAKCLEDKKPTIAQQLNKLPIGSVIMVDDKKYQKSSPCYQFKKPFWMCLSEFRYISPKHIGEYTLIS